MPMAQLSLLRRVLTALCTLWLVACSTAVVDKTDRMTPAELYAEAKDASSNGQYDKAITLFDKLEARAAGTPLSQQAQLDKAYVYYKTSEPAMALATLDRYIRLYPASPALDYALYLKGLVNFNENLGFLSSITQQDLSERDQKASRDSYDTFSELVSRFPDSKYAADAKLRMNYIVTSLSKYEVHVAKYYYKRGAYLAAINRAQYALNEYHGVAAAEDALFILYKSYEALGMSDLQADSKRLLQQNFPESKLLVEGEKNASSPWWKLW